MNDPALRDGAPRHRAFLWLGLAGAAALLLEGLASGLLAIAAAWHLDYQPIDPTELTIEDRHTVEQFSRNEGDYVTHSPTLGWTLRPHGVSVDGYRANGQGLRGDREYAITPPADQLRIAAFGDSHVHCDEVGNPDTWEAALERLNTGLEVINFGVGGFGPDQAFLRFQEQGIPFQPDIVLIGFMAENINRAVSVFRSFYQPASPFAKPRFLLNGDGLQLAPNPLPTLADYGRLLATPAPVLLELGRHDYWFQTMPHAGPLDGLASMRLFKTALYLYRRGVGPTAIIGPDRIYRPDTEALEVVQRLFTRFHDEARRAGALPIFLLFPSHNDILRYTPPGPKRYQPLIQHFDAHGFRYIDLLDAFYAAAGKYEPGPVYAHFTPAENGVIAAAVRNYLATNALTTRAAIREARDAEH